MLIRLIRNQPHGSALTGSLYVDSLITEEGLHQYHLSMHTLEHMDYAIPDGFYRLRMTFSPRFQEVLPLLDHVIGYQKQIGICTSNNINVLRSDRSSPVGRDKNTNQQPLRGNQLPAALMEDNTSLAARGVGERNVVEQSCYDCCNNTPVCGGFRTGIRIHAGNTIKHTTGCILVGDLSCLEDGSDAASTSLIASSPLASSPDRLLFSRKRLEELRTYLLNYIKQNPHEEIYIQLESPDPYPDADLACSYEQQAHIAESFERAQRLREERELSDEAIGL